MTDLLPCCGAIPEIVDLRTKFAVKCTHCKRIAVGFNIGFLDSGSPFLDDIGADEIAERAFDLVDWDALRETAITAWNTRTPPQITDAMVDAALLATLGRNWPTKETMRAALAAAIGVQTKAPGD